jgi:hypothetical protein
VREEGFGEIGMVWGSSHERILFSSLSVWGIFRRLPRPVTVLALTNVKKQAIALPHACTRLLLVDLQEQDKKKENLRHSFT